MKHYKWRIVLSVADTLLSLGLSPQFYHGLLAHSRAVVYLVWSLNLVPAAFVEVTGISRTYHVVLGGQGSGWLFYFFWNSQFLNFLFWWWVGWRIDMKDASRDSGLRWSLVEVIFGFMLALMLLLAFSTRENVAIQVATIGWIAALVCYSFFRLARVRAMLRLPSGANRSALS